MKCPHCLDSFHPIKINTLDLGLDAVGRWSVKVVLCPACNMNIVYLLIQGGSEIMVLPKGVSRSPLPQEVPEKYAVDYKEACLVLSDSPKASAALSRRCLQNFLRDEFKVRPANLSDEIQEVIDTGKLPTFLSGAIDAVRNIGNFAAHPLKSQSTGEIVPVEPGEAEWTLDVLERLFDFCFVQPLLLEKQRKALNEKLADAGKPPMK